AQFGKLADGLRIPLKPRGEGPNSDPGQQIPDDGWQPNTTGDHPTDKCEYQRHRDIDQQCDFVHSISRLVVYLSAQSMIAFSLSKIYLICLPRSERKPLIAARISPD